MMHPPLVHAEVKHYANETAAIWLTVRPIPKNTERTIFAALYFGLVGRG